MSDWRSWVRIWLIDRSVDDDSEDPLVMEACAIVTEAKRRWIGFAPCKAFGSIAVTSDNEATMVGRCKKRSSGNAFMKALHPKMIPRLLNWQVASAHEGCRRPVDPGAGADSVALKGVLNADPSLSCDLRRVFAGVGPERTHCCDCTGPFRAHRWHGGEPLCLHLIFDLLWHFSERHLDSTRCED